MAFRLWRGFKWILRGLVSLLVIAAVGWAAYQMTPGKRSARLITHAREKTAVNAWGEAVVAMRKAAAIYAKDRATRWLLANTLFKAGNPEEAIAEMEKALMLPPFDEASYQELFQAYYSIVRTAGNPGRMRTQAIRMRRVMPPRLRWMADTLEARSLFLKAKFQASTRLFQQALKNRAKNHWLRIDMAESLLASGKAKQALSIFRHFLEISPNDLEASRGLAAALASMGNMDEAVHAYVRASLNAVPPPLDILLTGARFSMNIHKLEDAKHYFVDRLVEYYPDNKKGKLMQMQYAVLVNNETRFFHLAGSKGLDFNPAEFSGMVQWCIAGGQPRWGLRLLKDRMPSGMDADVRRGLRAGALLKLHQPNEARKIISRISDKRQRQLRMADLDMETGKLEKARKGFAKAASTKPEVADKFATAISLYSTKQMNKIDEYRKSVSTLGLLPRSRILLAQGKAAEVLRLQQGIKNMNAETQLAGIMAMLQLGRQQQAAARLNTLLGKHPENESAWIIWGRLISETKPENALKKLEHAIASGADNPGVRSLIGEIQYKLKRHKAAIHTWKSVAERWPEFTIAKVFLAQAYMVRGNWSAAVDIWEKVLPVAPDDPLTLNNLAYSLLQSGKNYARAKQLAERALLIEPRRPEFSDTLKRIKQVMHHQSPRGTPVSPGVDGLTKAGYGEHLMINLGNRGQ